MKYRHWFWDFDGTLFNTYPRICRAFQKSLADAGIFEDTSVILPLIKQTMSLTAEVFGNKYHVSPEALIDGYHVHSEEEDLSTMQPYPGMRDFLCAIMAAGGYNYLYTHRGESVFKALKAYDLEPLFTDIVTSQDGFPGKPAPDALLYLMDKHRLTSEACVMVGDRVIDLQAGLNASIEVICLDPDGLCPAMPGVPLFHSYQALSDAMTETSP